ncbi:MAG: PC4/YdbC family ssDNA-binding protein [Endomicrobiales bacterium]
MNSTLVAKIAKNKREEIRIAVLKNNKIDIRTYFYFPDESEPKPTKKGIWLSFKQLPPIVGAFDKYLKDPKEEFKLEFELSVTEKIRVYVNEYMGSKVIHIRTFYLKDNEFAPGKGISFSTTLLEKMRESFKELQKYNADR